MAIFSSEWFKAVVTLSLGWFLNSLTQYFQAIRQKREYLRRALSDLLEMRHLLIAPDAVLNQIKEMVPIPLELEPQVTKLFDQLLPNTEQLGKRYDETISLIASVDPLLAFRLRSKDMVRPMLQRLMALFGQQPASAAFAEHMRKTLIPLLEDELCECAKSIAWKIGPFTRWRVGQKLQKRGFSTEGIKAMKTLKVELERFKPAEGPSGTST
jgi:hypothetical protein